MVSTLAFVVTVNYKNWFSTYYVSVKFNYVYLYKFESCIPLFWIQAPSSNPRSHLQTSKSPRNHSVFCHCHLQPTSNLQFFAHTLPAFVLLHPTTYQQHALGKEMYLVLFFPPGQEHWITSLVPGGRTATTFCLSYLSLFGSWLHWFAPTPLRQSSLLSNVKALYPSNSWESCRFISPHHGFGRWLHGRVRQP